ncbi:hypothetical protein DFAR_3500006 [Desulfarculales bacterium]
MHTVAQFQGDSKPIPPIILAGQNNLAEYIESPYPWPPGWWPEAIWPASPSRTCRPTSCTTSKT